MNWCEILVNQCLQWTTTGVLWFRWVTDRCCLTIRTKVTTDFMSSAPSTSGHVRNWKCSRFLHSSSWIAITFNNYFNFYNFFLFVVVTRHRWHAQLHGSSDIVVRVGLFFDLNLNVSKLWSNVIVRPVLLASLLCICEFNVKILRRIWFKS